MASFNSVTLLGNLVRDPELKYTPGGKAVADISLAINKNWTDDSGQKQSDVTYVDCTAFGRTAEICGQYLKKGSPALVAGHLKQETWDDRQTGAKRSKLKAVIENLQLLGDRQTPAPGPPASNQPPQRQTVATSATGPEPPDFP